MTTITREQAQKIIEAADDVINAIAGNHDDVSPESDGMLRLWDDLNDRYAPPEVVRELARIALASLTAEPVAWTDAEELRDLRTVGFCEMFTVEPVSKDADMYRVIPLYTDSPVPERERIRHEHAEWSYADPVVFTDERNLRHIASGRETSLIWGKQNQEVGDIPLYRHAQPVPVDKEFIPKNLDKALGVVGVALPESKEEFNFQIERWIQLLIDRVIRYADEFKEQPAPVVPPEKWVNPDINYAEENGFAEGWNACRAAMLNGGKS
ncbi:hypothetical protein I3B33_21550 [Salmonella enterica]|uniref:hypothetical protein n=1 Tax=Salmonella enterica TaxID=28901 RepID=UPI00127F0386|nr:hypothetical protein [Salmonella enterica]EBQ8841649.1 hypothetical protein [Salmonella enterica subsp. enterica serovar Derby]EDG5172594.1 hypothetical protein [Salmonella enterica subsp. enterica serovar Derby]EEC5568490.1 hypothetical protein [Salmonella enterica subsp. enterica serovar Derby]MBH0377434.1 hypothetical protein [Salmonella enterica]MBH0409463.1 hypothetical protein [Salmonella enterica]